MFQVNDTARIPIQISQNLAITEEKSGELISFASDTPNIGIETNKESTLYPNNVTKIYFKITPSTKFFWDENLLLKAIGKWVNAPQLPKAISDIMTFIRYSFDLANFAVEYMKAPPIVIDTALGIISVIWDGVVLFVAPLTLDPQRECTFTSDMTWKYIQSPDGSLTDYTTFSYTPLEINTTKLQLSASSDQQNNFNSGLAAKALSIPLEILSLAAPFPADVGFAVGAFLANSLCGSLWDQANDDLPSDQNYTAIYQPQYPSFNLTVYEPKNEFEALLLQYINASAQYLGDYQAFNITSSRRGAAMAAGDYEAVINQDSALVNYTNNVIADSVALKNDMELLNYHISENVSYYVNESYALESNISQNGLSEQSILVLESFGYNQTEISQLNQTIISLAGEHIISQNITSTLSLLDESLKNSTELLNTQIKSYEDFVTELNNETINTKTQFLNESITTASNETIQELEQLKNDTITLYNNGEWNAVIEKANQLIELAQNTALETNNNTYLEYISSAQDYKKNAEQYLKIYLYHLEELEVTETDTKNVTVIAQSGGAPTADYFLETNVSWVTSTQQTISITQYQRTTVELTISTQDQSPGTYPVNLKLYLPQTHTIIDSILTVKVVDKSPPTTTISLNGTPGLNGWYTSNVTVTLTATDPTSPTDVNKTEYSLDGTNWFTYSVPFTITTEGVVTVYFNSTDQAGNVETTKSQTIWIDQTPPATQLIIGIHYTDGKGNIYVTSSTWFTLTATDSAPGSGVANTYYRINGGNWTEYVGAFNITGPIGTYTIDYYSVDGAGNQETPKTATVIMEQAYHGWGSLVIGKQWFRGNATLFLSEHMIRIQVDNQTATWNITKQCRMDHTEFYYGKGELGKILLMIHSGKTSTHALAIGGRAFFCSCPKHCEHHPGRGECGKLLTVPHPHLEAEHSPQRRTPNLFFWWHGSPESLYA